MKRAQRAPAGFGPTWTECCDQSRAPKRSRPDHRFSRPWSQILWWHRTLRKDGGWHRKVCHVRFGHADPIVTRPLPKTPNKLVVDRTWPRAQAYFTRQSKRPRQVFARGKLPGWGNVLSEYRAGPESSVVAGPAAAQHVRNAHGTHFTARPCRNRDWAATLCLRLFSFVYTSVQYVLLIA